MEAKEWNKIKQCEHEMQNFVCSLHGQTFFNSKLCLKVLFRFSFGSIHVIQTSELRFFSSFYSIRTTTGIAINFVFHSCAHCAFLKLIENGNNNYKRFARFRFVMLKFGLQICSCRPTFFYHGCMALTSAELFSLVECVRKKNDRVDI